MKTSFTFFISTPFNLPEASNVVKILKDMMNCLRIILGFASTELKFALHFVSQDSGSSNEVAF